jgi:hypothetical protein
VASIEARAIPAIGAERVERLKARAAAPPDLVAGEVVKLEANRIEVRVRAPDEGIAVVNETMYPGWKVWIDGQPARPFCVTWLVRGVAVGPGEHAIVWKFEPDCHRLYRWLWSLAFLSLLAAAFARRRRIT